MAKKIEMGPEIKNFRELLNHSIEKYKENIAYKYKKSLKEPIEYIEKNNLYRGEQTWEVKL